jgi:hypothetical protein
MFGDSWRSYGQLRNLLSVKAPGQGCPSSIYTGQFQHADFTQKFWSEIFAADTDCTRNL